ncbi:FIST signal transduction protein [Desulfogranum marinum]|uniref:FIST signal transduction protein n=1 Tax=Desulfogranum marinum TaxID=453220 RepID=UPI001965B19B|nr:FIST C-terminal domain-containing protein [Desulfogranum marinum]MBM9514892.1 FIST C-terminal domain-containing protein [Desulfogranum marinum]
MKGRTFANAGDIVASCLYTEEGNDSIISEWLVALRAMHGSRAGVIALVAEQSKALVPKLQQAATEAGLALVGGVFPRVIVEDSFRPDGVVLIGMMHMPDYILHGDLNSENGVRRAVSALRDLVEPQQAKTTLFMIFDGLFDRIASLLEELFYEVGTTCKYAGVCGGSETFQPLPCVFDTSRLVADGVIAFLLPNNPGGRLEHGYIVPEQALIASSTTGNRVSQIDWQPAFDRYRQLVAEHYGERITHQNFYQFGVHYPFALIRGENEILIRIPVAVVDDGSLLCIGEIPQGALLTVAKAVLPGSTDTVVKLGNSYKATNAPQGMFFYCAGRRMHLGESAACSELLELSRFLPSQPLYGALTLGEIGQSQPGGYPLFHNAAIVAIPLNSDE